MKVLLLAGEESGKMYADQIAAELRGCEVRGFADYGFAIADLAVMGIWPILKRLGYFLNVRRTMMRAIDEWRPDVVCTIDYPGMNLRLAAYAKKRGIRAVHVVCPHVWAWKRGRIPKIEAALDKLLCFFPFEPSLFSPGFAEFVGHPLADAFEKVCSLQFAVCSDGRTDFSSAREKDAPPQLQTANCKLQTPKTLAILPGSRIGEIERNLPTLLEAANMLQNVAIEIPAANNRAKKAISRILAASPLAQSTKVLDGGARQLLLRADVAAVASGTATLEAALARCPTVLVYRVSALFAWLARRFITGVKHIGLANIVWEKAHPDATEFPMPELLQENFTADAVAAFLRKWLNDENERRRAISSLDATCNLLTSSSNAISRIASELRVES